MHSGVLSQILRDIILPQLNIRPRDLPQLGEALPPLTADFADDAGAEDRPTDRFCNLCALGYTRMIAAYEKRYGLYPKEHEKAQESACRAGRIGVLKQLSAIRRLNVPRLAVVACECGGIDVLRWLLQTNDTSRLNIDFNEMVAAACTAHNVAMLSFLEEWKPVLKRKGESQQQAEENWQRWIIAFLRSTSEVIPDDIHAVVHQPEVDQCKYIGPSLSEFGKSATMCVTWREQLRLDDVTWDCLRRMTAPATDSFPYHIVVGFLDLACRHGDLEVAKRWFAGQPVEPFVAAAIAGGGHMHVVEWLLEQQPNTTVTETVFAAACKWGKTEILDWLCEHCAVDVSPNSGTALLSQCGSLAACKWVLAKHHPKVDAQCLWAIVGNITGSGAEEWLKWLLDRYLSVAVSNRELFRDRMRRACCDGELEIVKLLAKIVIMPDNEMIRGACVGGYIRIAEFITRDYVLTATEAINEILQLLYVSGPACSVRWLESRISA